MNKIDGQVNVSGTIAYVPQTAWVLNATLKQNILFGKDFHEQLYHVVIEACALKPDFGMKELSCLLINIFDFRYITTTR